MAILAQKTAMTWAKAKRFVDTMLMAEDDEKITMKKGRLVTGTPERRCTNYGSDDMHAREETGEAKEVPTYTTRTLRCKWPLSWQFQRS